MEGFGKKLGYLLTAATATLSFAQGGCANSESSGELSSQREVATETSGAQPEKKPKRMSIEEIVSDIDCSVHVDTDDAEDITDQQLLEILKCDDVKLVEFKMDSKDKVSLRVTLASGKTVDVGVLLSFGQDLQKYLMNAGIDTKTKYKRFTSSDVITFASIFTMLAVLGFVLWRLRGPKSSKKHSPLSLQSLPDVKFDDIGGLRHVKEELRNLVDLIKNRENLKKLNRSLPRGVLFTGPPGGGKTLAARAVATEAGVPFISISGAEIVTVWIGETSRAIRELFERAKMAAAEKGACVVFVDELDAIGARRTDSLSSTGKEQNAIVNQFLTCMDGFEPSSGIVVLGATNRPELLDKALIRKKRFDREIFFPYPDQAGRLELFRIFTKGVPLASDVRFETLASTLVGKSGADIESLVDTAKISASKREGPLTITQEDLLSALDTAILGVESDLQLSEDEKKMVAVHEAGHAVLALSDPNSTVERVSIVPRGRSLGVTVTPPIEEKNLLTRTDLEWQIKMLLAGRLAELSEFGDVSTGSADDIKKATERAVTMVTQMGMFSAGTDGLCDVRCYADDSAGAVDRERGGVRSPALESAIDGILNRCKQEAQQVLGANGSLLMEITERLIQGGVIERDELMRIFEGHKRVAE